MKYIGPFFRMSSLSQEEICGQLFHFSKESLKTLVLKSKCGCLSQVKANKKSKDEKLDNQAPLLCIYKKSEPTFLHNKVAYGFDSSTFKKEVCPTTNALMTLSLLELYNYYSFFTPNSDEENFSRKLLDLSKEQLDFYYSNLRNNEGIFITKKNIFETSSKTANFIDKNRKLIFSDQAFMMVAYFMHSTLCSDENTKNDFLNFSNQILQMFLDYNDALYNLSFDDGVKTLFAFNIYFENSKNDKIVPLIIDLTEFLCDKFNEKDYFIDNLDICSLFSISLSYSYEHTNLSTFKDKSNSIIEKLLSLYNEEENVIHKITDKKEIKYSSSEICLYFLAILCHSLKSKNGADYKNMISNIYKKYILNSGIITSWPKAPNLDELERYKAFSMLSKDMVDETFFRMPELDAPETSGVCPIFIKNISYSIKKDKFKPSKLSFDSSQNMLILFIYLYFLKDNFYRELEIANYSKIETMSSDDSEYIEAEIVTDEF